MSEGPRGTAAASVVPAAMPRLRGPFLTLVAALLVAVSASVTAGFVGIGHLDRALREIAVDDTQRLLFATHVRRLFRSELVLVHELSGARDPAQRQALEARRTAVRREREALLGKLHVLGVPGEERALQVLDEEHRTSTLPAFRQSDRWEAAVASLLDAIEVRLVDAARAAEARGRMARALLVVVSSLAAALAVALGGLVLRRVRTASRALAASEEQFRRVVESAPSLLAILSPERALALLPPRGPGFLGVPRERLQAEPLCWVHPQDRVELEVRLDEALREAAGSTTVRLRAVRDDASIWHASVSVTPLADEEGVARGIVLQILDVTQQHEAEQARLALEDQLRQSQKMESIGRLAGGIAHDFNNLLTAIRGYASLAQMAAPSGATGSQHIEGIVAAADRATALTRQLLAFSRKHVIAPRPTALGELLGRLETLLVRLIGEDVRLEVRTDPALGRCLVDVNQVEQVVVNLAVNARDAMPNGGRLLIEATNAELGESAAARHPGTKAGRYVLLCVSDTGVGMSREVQSRLFEPFFTTKPRGQGTGLGLSVVYGTVQQHGGTIEIQSEPGLGTSVRIYWPRIEDEAVADAAPSEPDVSARGSGSILLVEDDPLVRGFSAEALSSHGYDVLVAANAVEAMRIASGRSAPPDLLVTDVILPDRKGHLLAKDLASRWPEMPVLFCSGYSARLLSESGRLAPDVDYLQKPYDARTLVNRVRAALDAAARRRTAGDGRSAGRAGDAMASYRRPE